MAGHIQTAARTDWCTPPEIVSVVRQAFGGQIDLDPCSNARSVVGARKNYTIRDDGLARKWRGNAYVNPPYGRGLNAWVRKAVHESHGDWPANVIMLIPAAVGTVRWQTLVFPEAKAICFIDGRVKFIGAAASAPMDCALVNFGNSEAPYFTAVCDKYLGFVVHPQTDA
jgi:phage N-6-adenine-methyltransferase